MLASLASSALFLSIASASPQGTQADSAAPKAPYAFNSRYGLSLSAGSTSGIGLGFRKHFDNRWGFSATGLPILGKDSGFASVGTQVYYSFVRRRIVRLYVLAGISGNYRYSTRMETTFVPAPQDNPSSPGQDTVEPSLDENGLPKPDLVPGPQRRFIDRLFTLGVGPGLGVELHFTKRFSWAIELPVATMIRFERATTGSGVATSTRVLPIPNTAITLYY